MKWPQSLFYGSHGFLSVTVTPLTRFNHIWQHRSKCKVYVVLTYLLTLIPCTDLTLVSSNKIWSRLAEHPRTWLKFEKWTTLKLRKSRPVMAVLLLSIISSILQFFSLSLIHDTTQSLETNEVFYSDLNSYVVPSLQASPNGSACFILAPYSWGFEVTHNDAPQSVGLP